MKIIFILAALLAVPFVLAGISSGNINLDIPTASGNTLSISGNGAGGKITGLEAGECPENDPVDFQVFQGSMSQDAYQFDSGSWVSGIPGWNENPAPEHRECQDLPGSDVQGRYPFGGNLDIASLSPGSHTICLRALDDIDSDYKTSCKTFNKCEACNQGTNPCGCNGKYCIQLAGTWAWRDLQNILDACKDSGEWCNTAKVPNACARCGTTTTTCYKAIQKWKFNTEEVCNENPIEPQNCATCQPPQVAIRCDEDTCTNTCQTLGEKECRTGFTNQYRECTTNADADSCREWTGWQTCPPGQECANGECQLICGDEGQPCCTGTCNPGLECDTNPSPDRCCKPGYRWNVFDQICEPVELACTSSSYSACFDTKTPSGCFDPSRGQFCCDGSIRGWDYDYYAFAIPY